MSKPSTLNPIAFVELPQPIPVKLQNNKQINGFVMGGWFVS